MVTFFCAGCAQYLRKRQAEEHPHHCSETLSCIECRKDFMGTAQIRAHTDCHPPNPDPKKRGQLVAAARVEFSGVRNTARRMVRGAPGRKLAFAEVKARMAAVLRREGRPVDDLDNLLREKLSRAKNITLSAHTVAYTPPLARA